MTEYDEWARALKTTRMQAGLLRRIDLARAAGLSKGTIDEWEQGRRLPRGDSWLALKRALPDVPSPMQVSEVATSDPRDPNGYAVHLPMDPARRAEVLAEMLALAMREAREGRDRKD